MKILVFLHGTTIMHHGAIGHSRKDRVRQVQKGETSVSDYAEYVPIGNAPRKLRRWQAQGAEILYFSSHRNIDDIEKDKTVLYKYEFPHGTIFFRQNGEEYADTAMRVMPDVLIEDDCESIGGEKEMAFPHLPPDIQQRIHSIVVPEFGGIDDLPDDLASLT